MADVIDTYLEPLHKAGMVVMSAAVARHLVDVLVTFASEEPDDDDVTAVAHALNALFHCGPEHVAKALAFADPTSPIVTAALDRAGLVREVVQ